MQPYLLLNIISNDTQHTYTHAALYSCTRVIYLCARVHEYVCVCMCLPAENNLRPFLAKLQSFIQTLWNCIGKLLIVILLMSRELRCIPFLTYQNPTAITSKESVYIEFNSVNVYVCVSFILLPKKDKMMTGKKENCVSKDTWVFLARSTRRNTELQVVTTTVFKKRQTHLCCNMCLCAISTALFTRRVKRERFLTRHTFEW